MTNPIKVLLVEDNPGDARLAQEMLRTGGRQRFAVEHVERLEQALTCLDREPFDITLLDLSLPDAEGMNSLLQIQDAHPDLPVIVLSGLEHDRVGAEAVERGAQDYLVKGGAQEDALARSIRYAIQRKRDHVQLREAMHKAEVANRTKSEFLANMSHELRTPLNAIIGFAELIGEEKFGAIGHDNYREYIQDIHMSAGHLLSLINDILDLSKIEAGHLELAEDCVRLPALVRDCLRITKQRLEASGLKFHQDLPPDLPAVMADERALKQVLVNLLSNAIKFNAPGGSITVSAVLEGTGELRIRVADSGIGMAPDDVPRALEPFRQIDGSMTRQFDGTGLGLPLSKRLVEAHGGSFEVASRLGEGTTITITLPAERIIAAEPGRTTRVSA